VSKISKKGTKLSPLELDAIYQASKLYRANSPKVVAARLGRSIHTVRKVWHSAGRLSLVKELALAVAPRTSPTRHNGVP
jgi:hypothetical protein